MTLKKILLILLITILTLSGTALAAISYTLSTVPNPLSIYTGDSTTVSVSISNNNVMYKGICAISLDSSSWSTEYPVSSGHTITQSISLQAPVWGSGDGSVQHTVNSYCYSTLDSTKVYQSTSFILTYTENPRYIASQAINSAQSAVNSAQSSINNAQNTITAAKNIGADVSNAEVKLTNAQTAYQNAQSQLGNAQNSFNQNTIQSFDLATQYANEASNYAKSAKAGADNANVLAKQASELQNAKSKADAANVGVLATQVTPGIRTQSATTPAIPLTSTQTPQPSSSEMLDQTNWVLVGGAILAILLVGALVLRMRKPKENETKAAEKTTPFDVPAEEPDRKSKAVFLEKSKEPEVKKPKESGAINVKSAYEYKGAKIYFKIKVENNTIEPISDIKVHLFVPDVFLLSEKEKSLSMLEPKESKTVTFEIRPTGECGDCNVSGKVEYYDYSTKGRQMLDIETKSLSIICPVLKRKEIDLKQWEQITDALIKAEENINELSVPAENLFNITSRVIKDSGMFLLKPEITSTPQLFNGIAMFYAEGVTGLRYAAYIEVVGGARKSRMILKVWAEKEEALTGFYHRILDEIEKRIDVKIFIDDAIVQQHIHIGDKIGTQVKDSFVQRSNIGAGVRKCPKCYKEAGTDEKFCNECGEKL